MSNHVWVRRQNVGLIKMLSKVHVSEVSCTLNFILCWRNFQSTSLRLRVSIRFNIFLISFVLHTKIIVLNTVLFKPHERERERERSYLKDISFNNIQSCLYNTQLFHFFFVKFSGEYTLGNSISDVAWFAFARVHVAYGVRMAKH